MTLFRGRSFWVQSSAGAAQSFSLARLAARSASTKPAKPLPEKMPIYVDNQATTPVDERVVAKMLPTFSEKYGNAHSRTHAYGWQAEALCEEGRNHIAELINALPKEIIFTSGATEANNLAIKGVAEFYGKKWLKQGIRPHIITAQTEHKCVLASTQYLQTEKDYDVTYLAVDADGMVSEKELKHAIRPETILVSIMTVNHEIGVIQNVKKLVEIVREANPDCLFHTDAAQAVGKIPVDVKSLDVDLLSMSGHKMYAPKGIGALYVRATGPRPRVRLTPILHGGGQERGIRSGTLPVSLCVGFGEAARIAKAELLKNQEYVRGLATYFWDKLAKRLPSIRLNGHAESRYPGNCNISFDCVEGESLIMMMEEVAVSSGSACTSASLEPSYVLRAIGVDEELAHTSLRFAFSKNTTLAEVDRVADLVCDAVEKLRSMSPLWEMKETGETDELHWT